MNNKMQKLKIATWNGRGITRKASEIEYFLNSYNIEVMLIQETWLKEKTPFELQNYQVYREYRKIGKGGGTAIAVKKTLKHKKIPTNPLEIIEAVIIEILDQEGKELYLISAHKKPIVGIP